MAVTIFACPECSSTLKSKQALAAGTKIKCPKCQTIFAIPERNGEADADEEPRPSKQVATAGKAVAKKPVPKPPPRPQEEFAEYDDGDDDEVQRDDDEEDVRPKKKKKLKGKKKRPAISPALIGGIAGLVLLLVVGYVLGWVWPGFFYRPGDEPLAYLPPNSTAVLSVDFEAAAENFGAGGQIDNFLPLISPQLGFTPATFKSDTGLELKEMFQKMILATSGPLDLSNTTRKASQSKVLILKSKVAFDRKKMITHLKLGDAAQSLKWKTYYKKKINNETVDIFIPNDRLIVWCDLPEKDLGMLLTSKGKAPVPTGDLRTMIDTVGNSQLWGVAIMDASMKKSLEGLAGSVPLVGGSLKDAINQGKSAAFWVAVENSQVKYNIGMMCTNSEEAQKAKKTFETIWKGVLLALGNTMDTWIHALPPQMQALAKQVKDSIRFSSQDSLALASTQVSLQALKAMNDEILTKGFPIMGPGGMPGSFPGGPGGFPRGGPQPGGPPRGGRRPR